MSDEENLLFDEYYKYRINKDENDIEKQFPYINSPNEMNTFVNEESTSEINRFINSGFENNYIGENDNNLEEESEEEDNGPYFDLYETKTREPTINLEY